MAKKDADDLEAPKKGGKLVLIIVIFGLLLLGGAGYMGAAYFLQLPPFEPGGPTPEEIAAMKAEQEKEERLLQRDVYVPFNQTFNFTIKSDRKTHSGQVDVVLVVVGDVNADLAHKHLTLINSVIFERLSAQSYEVLLKPSGRQRLKRELQDAIRAKMTEVAKNPVVEKVLLTSFVMQ